jgi:transcriptional regulator with XRE-family HTH domain
MNKYPKQLSKEEAEELREMRKKAGLSQYKIAEYMHCKTSKIELLEKGGAGVDLNFLERLKKRYQLIIKYKNT